MNSDLTLLILRIGFLLLLWLFIFAIVYALRSDLFGAPVRRLPVGTGAATRGSPPSLPAAPGPAPTPAPAPIVTAPSGSGSGSGSGPARRLVITSGKAAGTAIPLDEDIITIGRSSDSTLVIVDEYTSTYHARLHRSGERWTLTDLDSTNGTRVGGTRVTDSVPLPTFTPVTIGTTTFELRP